VRAIKRELRYDDAASVLERMEEEEREEEKEEDEKDSVTFELSTTLRKFDRSHGRVQPITSTPCTKIIQLIESFESVFETTDDSLRTKV